MTKKREKKTFKEVQIFHLCCAELYLKTQTQISNYKKEKKKKRGGRRRKNICLMKNAWLIYLNISSEKGTL